MIEVNLLPKDYRKRGINLSFGKTGMYAMAGAAGVVLMLLAITWFQIGQLSELDDNIARAEKRAQMLQRDIQIVDALTDVKYKITARVAAVERLDRNRSSWVRILEQMAGTVPDFVWLTRFAEGEAPSPREVMAKSSKKSKKDKKEKSEAELAREKAKAIAARYAQPAIRNIELEGYAFTLNSVAALMINMMRSDYFEDVELVFTNETQFDEHRAYNFLLNCNMHFLSDEQARQAIVKAAANSGLASVDHQNLN
jgi:Tfp pilus assembly protein PilN